MAVAITLIVVALFSGFIGHRIERSRSSLLTKSDARQLRRQVAQVEAIFEAHFDAHKVMVYNMEILARDVATIAKVIGIKQVQPRYDA
jgi:hypothetical protein